MADIELVIKIPEKLACEGFERLFTEEEKNILIKAIGNGTPLPKGHGRLIDADILRNEMEKDPRRAMSFVDLEDFVLLASTIIEADKEQEDEK